MTDYELYRKLNEAFSMGSKNVSSVLESLGVLAERCDRKDISDWANKELYGYNKGEVTQESADYRCFPVCAVGQYCGGHAIPGVNPLCSPNEVERIKMHCGIDTSKKYPVEDSCMVLEERIRCSSGRVALVDIGHVKASKISELDIAGVRIACEVVECIKCLVAVRKQAKDYFGELCDGNPQITKDPNEKKDWMKLWFTVVVAGFFTLLGSVVGAVIPRVLTSSTTHQCICCQSKDYDAKVDDAHSPPLDNSAGLQKQQGESVCDACSNNIQNVDGSNVTNMPKYVVDSQVKPGPTK